MTGYQSKKAAAQAKTIDEVNWVDHEPNGLVHTAQEPVAMRLCRSCNGTGMQYTGIQEAPIATCNPCDGTGQIALAQPTQRQKVVFPTMLRKMWSGSEVQAWLDENV
jgi:hypothetical protein